MPFSSNLTFYPTDILPLAKKKGTKDPREPKLKPNKKGNCELYPYGIFMYVPWKVKIT